MGEPLPPSDAETTRKGRASDEPQGGAEGDDTELGTSDTAAGDVSSASLSPGPAGADAHADTMATPMGAGDPDAETGESASDPMLGQVLAERYEISRRIGKGGMGAVYEATHTKIGKRMAIKVLLDKYQERDQVSLRLEQEARLASSIGHENIIDITDVGHTDDGRTFVAMEYLEGESLGQLLSRTGPLDGHRAVRIARQVASALGAAHDKGIVHRDVKPDNIFLLKRKGRDFVKVVDFGISKSLLPTDGSDSPRLTQTGMVLGTPLYMSPEQARGDDELDHRIDVYALGVILYEMVTGEVPFSGSNYLSVLAQVAASEPALPSERVAVNPDLEAVILKAMSKDPDGRYASMEELDADLALVEESDPRASSLGMGVTAAGRQRRSRSKLRALWGLAGVAVVVTGVVLTVSMLLGEDERGGSQDREKPRPQPVAAVTPIDAAPPPPPPPDAAQVPTAVVEIVSRPPGATLYADGGGRELGPTPYSYRVDIRKEEVELIAELEGYDDTAVTFIPRLVDGQTVKVRLKKVKEGAVKRRLLRKRPKSSGAGVQPAGGSGGDRSDETEDETAGGDLTPNPYD